MRYDGRLLAISALAALLLGAARVDAKNLPLPATATQDEIAGARLYQSKCQGCHALDRNKYGPSHQELFGRTAATQPGYRYSDALARSHVVWTEAALDTWLQNPGKMVPGTRMGARFTNPEERRLIIGFLKTDPK